MILAPTPNIGQLATIKVVLLAHLARSGFVQAHELQTLASGHVDRVLDLAFKHCGAVRVRVADDQYITIMPGGSVQ